MAKTILKTEGLTKHYGGIHALVDADFEIRDGEHVAIVGDSGAGKSTIVSLMLRLHDLERGRILIDGQDIARVSQDSLRRAIAVVTQDTSLLHRSIRDNIAYGRPGSGEAEIERAARLAHAHDFILSLEDHRGRRGYDAQVGERGVKLSGGQRQRVAIARALAPRSSLVVLDEALSALDVITQERVLQLIERIQREQGVSYLFISHDLSTVRRLAHDVVVLRAGRVVEQGGSRELFEAPRTDYVRELLDAVPGRRLLSDHSASPTTAVPAPTSPTAEEPR